MWRTWLKSGFEFSTKAASAALFGILLLIAFALTAPMASQEYFGFFRYDYLLFYALIIQVCLLYLKLESWAEAKVIALFLPFRHIELISQRDAQARSGLKKAIRLLKNVKADAIEERAKIPLPSFDIASAMWHAELQALAAGSGYELAIEAEAVRHLDYLARNTAHTKTLLVPDGSRPIFNTAEKLEALIQLSLEMDDLALQIGREQDRLLHHVQPSLRQVEEVLRRSVVPN